MALQLKRVKSKGRFWKFPQKKTSDFLLPPLFAIYSEPYFSFLPPPLPTPPPFLICLSHFYSTPITHPFSLCMLTLKVESRLNWPEHWPLYYRPAGIIAPPLSPPWSAFIPHSIPPSSSTIPLRKLRKIWETHQGPTETLKWRTSLLGPEDSGATSSHGCLSLVLITAMWCMCVFILTHMHSCELHILVWKYFDVGLGVI